MAYAGSGGMRHVRERAQLQAGGCCMNRRNFLGSVAAAGGVAMLAGARLAEAAPHSDVKITRVRILNPPNFKSLAGPVGLAETVVAIETSAGITGYGQGGTPDMLRYAASLLIGQDPVRT